MKGDIIKISKTTTQLAKERFPKTTEDLVDLIEHVRKQTIWEYRDKVTASSYFDTSNSEDDRDGFYRGVVNYPSLEISNIEYEAQILE